VLERFDAVSDYSVPAPGRIGVLFVAGVEG
jgi:hypothetical protein